MRKAWRPVLLGLCVAGATFALAQAAVFAPGSTQAGPVALGDVYAGETLYQDRCAGCHGLQGEGGAGPRLAGSGLAPAVVATRVRQGAGAMPAGLVEEEQLPDVLAYVDSLAQG